MTKNNNFLPILLETIAITGQTIPELNPSIVPSEPKEIVLSHKELVKSGITHKQPKPGKGKPAKGYNPETKKWEK